MLRNILRKSTCAFPPSFILKEECRHAKHSKGAGNPVIYATQRLALVNVVFRRIAILLRTDGKVVVIVGTVGGYLVFEQASSEKPGRSH